MAIPDSVLLDILLAREDSKYGNIWPAAKLFVHHCPNLPQKFVNISLDEIFILEYTHE